MVFYAILGEFGRDSVSGGRRVGVATNGGRDAVGSGRGAAPDAVDAAPVFRMLWRPLWGAGGVRGSDEVARALRPVYGEERRWGGYGGGDRGPGTPVDAAAAMDVVWSPGVLPAGP